MLSVTFRTDASIRIGTGHVMRCLTLADALARAGAECRFVCREHQGHLLDAIRQRGHQAVSLPLNRHRQQDADTASPPHAEWLGADWAQDASETVEALAGTRPDWLVVDHYALDFHWEATLRQHCRSLIVIDDLADREHDCEVLLDQNLGRESRDYSRLVPARARVLCGARFSLVRPEFMNARPDSLERRASPALRNILVTMGGIDKDNATGKVLECLSESVLASNAVITVVLGEQAPWLSEIQRQAAAMGRRVEVLSGVSGMAALMARSDLCIGAAGSTSWERCVVGLPAILLTIAENQLDIARALQQAGAALVATREDFARVLRSFLATADLHDRLSQMSAAAARVTDGSGAQIVADLLVQMDAP